MKDKKIKIGQILMVSLTAEQIACMLEVVASAGYLKSLMDDFIKADPDMPINPITAIMPLGAKQCMN